MATTLYFRADSATMSRGDNAANLLGTATNWTPQLLSTTAGAVNTTDAVGSVLGPTTLGVPAGVEYISPPLAANATISGAITARFCGTESSTAANASFGVALYKIDSTGTLSTRLLSYAVTFTDTGDLVTVTGGHNLANGDRIHFSSITSTTGITAYTHYYVVNTNTVNGTFQVSSTVGGAAIALTTNGSGTLITEPKMTAELTATLTGYAASSFTPFSSFTILKGERIRAVVYATDAIGVTMASGYTLTFYYNNSTTTYNSFVQFTENLTFQTTDPTTQTLYPLSTDYTTGANSVPGAAGLNELKMWTSRGAASTNAITNTALGNAAPIPITATAGGTPITWFSPALKATTLAGLVKLNIRALENSTSANATVRAELAITDSSGLNPTVWAAANAITEVTTADAAYTVYLSGQDTAIAAGQRLQLDLYIDDAPGVAMASGFTATVTYSGGSANAAGDTYMILPITLTEVVGVQNTTSAVAGAFAPTIIAGLRLDNTSESHTGTSGSISQASFSWSHAGNASSTRAVVVFIFNTLSASNIVSSVTYGSTTMKLISEATATDTLGEPGNVSTYFLGTAVPQGTQTVTVNRTNNTNELYAVAVTLKSTDIRDTEIGTSLGPVDANIVLLQEDGTMTEQNVTDGATAGTSVRMAAAYSGSANVPTAGTSSTVYQSATFGTGSNARSCALAVEKDSYFGTDSVGFNFTTSDDRAVVHLAVRYVPGIILTVDNVAGSVASAFVPSKAYTPTVDNTPSAAAGTSDHTVIGNAILYPPRTETVQATTQVFAPSKPITITVDNTPSASTNLVDVSFGLILNPPSTSTLAPNHAAVYAPSKPSTTNVDNITSATAAAAEPTKPQTISVVRADATATTYIPNKPYTVTVDNVAASTADVYIAVPKIIVNSVRAEATSTAYSDIIKPQTVNLTGTSATASVFAPAQSTTIYAVRTEATAQAAAPVLSTLINATRANATGTAFVPTPQIILNIVITTAQANSYAPTKTVAMTSVITQATAAIPTPSAGITIRPPSADASASVIAPPAQVYVTWAVFAGPTASVLQVVAPTASASADVYPSIAFYSQSLNVSSTFDAQMLLLRQQNISFALQNIFEVAQSNTVKSTLSQVSDLILTFLKGSKKQLEPTSSNFTGSTQKSTDKTSSISSTLSTVLTRANNLYRTVASSLSNILSLNSNTTRSIPADLSTTTSSSRVVSYSLSSASTLLTSFSRVLNKTINTSLTAGVASLRLITQNLAATLGYNVTITYQNAISVALALSNSLNTSIQKLIASNKNVTITNTLALTTQSLRFVALALLDSFTVNSSKLIAFSRSLTETLSANYSQLTAKPLALTETLTTSYSRLTAKILTLIETLTSTISRLTIKSISLNETLTINFARLIAKSVNINEALTTNITRLSSKLIPLTNTLNINYSRLIGKNAQLNAILDSVFTLYSNRFLSFSINSSFDINFTKLTTKSFALALQRYLFGNTITGGSSSTVSFDDTLNASSGSSTVDGNPDSAWVLTKNVLKGLNLDGNYLTLLINPFTKFVNLALGLYSLFDVNFNKAITRTISLSETLSSQIIKLADITLTSIGTTFNTVLDAVRSNLSLSQALEVVSSFSSAISKNTLLSITKINDFSTELNKLILKTLNITLTASATIFSQSLRFIYLALIDSFSSNNQQLIQTTKSLSSTFNINYSRLITKTLTSTLTLAASLFAQSLRLISLSIVDTFSTNYQKLISTSKSLNSILNTTILSQSLRFISLNLLDSFSLDSQKLTQSTKTLNPTFTASYARLIAHSLSTSFTLTTLILNQSLRFITIALTDVFTSSYQNLINTSKNLTSTLGVNYSKLTSKNLNFSQSLTILFVRSIAKNINSTLTAVTQILTQSLRLVTLAVIDSFDSSTQKLIDAFRTPTVSLNTNFIRATAKALTLSLSETVSIFTQSLRLISLAIVDTFTTSYQKLISTTKTTSPTFNINYNTLIAKTLNATLTSSVALLTQSLRLISLSIIDSFNVNSQKNVLLNQNVNFASTINILNQSLRALTLSILSNYSTVLAKNTLKTFNTDSILTPSFFKNISAFYNIGVEFITNVQKSITQFLNLLPTVTADRTVNVSKSFAVTSTYTINLIKLITQNINITLTAASNFAKIISKSISYTTQQTLQLATLAARFVTFAIANTFDIVSNKAVSTFQNIESGNTFNIAKSIDKSVTPSTFLNITLLLQRFSFVQLALMFASQNNITKNSSITVASETTFTASINKLMSALLSGTMSVTNNIQQSIDKFSSVEPLLTTNILRNSFKTIASSNVFNSSISRTIAKILEGVTLTTTNAISFLTSRLISLNINELMAPSFNNLVDTSLNLASSLSNNLGKNIAKFVELSESLNLSLLTQSFRFVSLAISNSFESLMNRQVGLLSSITATLNAQLIKTINFNLASFVESALSFNRIINTLTSVSTETNVTTQKAISTSITFANIFEPAITTLSSFYQTLSAVATNQLNILKQISNTVSLTLNSLFDSSIIKEASSNLTTSLETSLNNIKAVSSSIATDLYSSVLIIPNSLLSITLSLISNFEAATQSLANKFIDVVQGFALFIGTSLPVFLDVTTQLETFMSKGVSVALDEILSELTSNLNKTITSTLTISYEGLINLQNAIALRIESSVGATIAIYKMVSSLVALAINNLFDTAFARSVNKEVSAELSATTFFNRIVDLGLSLGNNLTTLTFTQSQRFINFAINSLQNLASQSGVAKFIETSSEVLPSILKNSLITLEDVIANLNTALSSAIGFNLSTSSEFITRLNSLTSTSLSVATEQLININNGVAINLNNVLTNTAEIVRIASSNITLAINNVIEPVLSTQTIKQLQSTLDFELDFKKLVNASLSLAAYVNPTLLFQSLRFVYFNILSSFEVSNFSLLVAKIVDNTALLLTKASKTVAITITAGFEGIVESFRNTAKNLVLSISNTLTRTSGVQLTFNIDSNTLIESSKDIAMFMSYELNLLTSLLKRFQKLFEITSESSIAFNKMIDKQIENSLNTFIDRFVNVQLAFNISSNFAANFVSQSLRFVTLQIINLFTTERKNSVEIFRDVSSTFNTAILNQGLRFLYMSLMNSFSTDSQRLTQITKELDSTLTVNYARLIAYNLSSSLTFITSILNQSSRFVLLAITDTFTSNYQKLINTSQSLTSEFNIEYLRLTTKNLDFSESFIVVSTRSIVKNIMSTLTTVAKISNQSLRFVTLALTDVFESNYHNLISTFKNLSSTLVTSQQKLTQRLINTVNTLSANIQINSRLTLFVLNENVAVFNRIINKTITIASTMLTSFVSQSLRFVSLALINTFEVVRNNETFISLSYVLENLTLIDISRTLTVLLEVVATLAPRRAHTLYSALTSFAVNKSQPGSEGSAQQTQRTSGGSARKRNNKNTGSTFFKRGNTDDLE